MSSKSTFTYRWLQYIQQIAYVMTIENNTELESQLIVFYSPQLKCTKSPYLQFFDKGVVRALIDVYIWLEYLQDFVVFFISLHQQLLISLRS